jgi:hypothetical protein
MAAKSLKIDSLDLDLENPRITLATDQRDAMQKILNEQKVKLINLAESIAAKGLNPMDRFLILRSHLRSGKFIVLEGNRRLLSAKLLKNPSLIHSLQMSDAFRKRLLKAAQGLDPKRLDHVDCFEVGDRAEGIDWIRQRHNREDGGRGIVSWSAVAGARFRGREPALQAFDFVLEYGGFSDDYKEQISANFPISTLERLISTPSVRTAIGLEIDKGKLLTELPPEEALKPLKKIVVDLADKNINVTALKSKTQQETYVGTFKATDTPDLTMKSGKQLSVESITEKDFKAKATPAPKKPRGPRPAARTNVVPKSCKLNVTTAKIAGIYGELRTLQLSKHVHAIGVLLRVFLEMSVDDYLENQAKVLLTFKDPKNNQTRDKKLKDKVKETIDHMVANGAIEKDFKGVKDAMADGTNPFSIDTLHAYIHNRFFTPTDKHLMTGWDNAQRFFEKIWS